MLKQLDKLLIRSFLGPFMVTFAIAMFVLMMQVLWLYLDDIAGKGLGFFLIMELMAYKCIGLVPLALPLSLLISSVMVLGSLAEHYELSSFKSAGVSLLRVMAPIIVFGALGTVASYACSDYLIPAANIQFGSRMYDIQQKKPTLNLEAGTFNEDFNQFAIHIGEKEGDGRTIKDILIYDHTKSNTGQLSEITAKDGEMFSANEGQYFVMRLYDGYQYSESSPSNNKAQRSFPFVRTAFDTYTKIFDLSEFKLKQTSRNLFSQNRSMLATWQLGEAVDSIDLDILERKQVLSNHLTNYLTILERDTIEYRPKPPPKKVVQGRTDLQIRDSLAREERLKRGVVKTTDAKKESEDKPKPSNNLSFQAKIRQNKLVANTKDWKGVSSIYDQLDENIKNRVMNRARSGARSILTQAESSVRVLPSIQETKVKHVYDLHMKYSMALVCIIFIFIGAPMGAIVRKGGFGYPILVSIIFFVLFIILTIVCRKLAESFVLSGDLAGWMPCIILFPMGLFLTIMAMNDRKLGSFDGFRKIGTLILQLFKKKGPHAPDTLDAN